MVNRAMVGMASGETDEHTINTEIGNIIRNKITNDSWKVDTEKNGLLENGRADFLIREINSPPIIIENEVGCDNGDAIERLGKKTRDGETLSLSIALITPDRFRKYDGNELIEKLETARDFRFALYVKSREIRYPASGYSTGNIDDLMFMAYAAKIESYDIDDTVEMLKDKINGAANVILKSEATIEKMGDYLKQSVDDDDNEDDIQKKTKQTACMAMIIVTNALVFHEYMSAINSSVKNLAELQGSSTFIKKSSLCNSWKFIMTEINYVPIFAVAEKLIKIMPTSTYANIIMKLHDIAEELTNKNIIQKHDLFGTLFQNMIADRDFLGTNYTMPASASLLTTLLFYDKKYWSLKNNLIQSKIGDFSCGTGALLLAVHREISRTYELNGGNMEEIHQVFIERVLHGYDVLPSALHLTASTLAGRYPSIQFSKTNFSIMKLGKSEDGVHLGSLEFLEKQKTQPKSRKSKRRSNHFQNDGTRQSSLYDTSYSLSGTRENEETWELSTKDNSFDVVIMNPPYTRSAHQTGTKTVSNPAFAAFNIPDDVQQEMGIKLKKISKDTCSDGMAGLATNFVAIADKKVKPGGFLALVLPMVSMVGESWNKFRAILVDNYEDIQVVSSASNKREYARFSADTDIAEILLIAKKIKKLETEETETSEIKKYPLGTFIVLNKRPDNMLIATLIGDLINNNRKKPHFDIKIGNEQVGSMFSMPYTIHGPKYVGISSLKLAQIAHSLSNGTLEIPSSKKCSINMCNINTIASIGKYDLNIKEKFESLNQNSYRQGVDYPSLWSHDADKERSLIISPDRALVKKTTKKDAYEFFQNFSSKICINRDMQFNSQSIVCATTPVKVLGGRGWPNILIKNSTSKCERALSLWLNSTLGVLSYWWLSEKQQSGRGLMPHTLMNNFTLFNITKLSLLQLEKLDKLFDNVSNKTFRPINEIDIDATRQYLDDAFLSIILPNYDENMKNGLTQIRTMMSTESSIGGSKLISRNDLIDWKSRLSYTYDNNADELIIKEKKESTNKGEEADDKKKKPKKKLKKKLPKIFINILAPNNQIYDEDESSSNYFEYLKSTFTQNKIRMTMSKNIFTLEGRYIISPYYYKNNDKDSKKIILESEYIVINF